MNAKKKRGQAWGFDVFMGFSIFIVGFLLFLLYTFNYPNEANESLDALTYESNFIADLILSEGEPTNWNDTVVVYPGITHSDRIDDTKLEKFYNLTLTQYNTTRMLFHTSHEYYISANRPFSIQNMNISAIGNNRTQNASNLIRTSRFTIYKNKPLTLYIYVWN